MGIGKNKQLCTLGHSLWRSHLFTNMVLSFRQISLGLVTKKFLRCISKSPLFRSFISFDLTVSGTCELSYQTWMMVLMALVVWWLSLPQICWPRFSRLFSVVSSSYLSRKWLETTLIEIRKSAKCECRFSIGYIIFLQSLLLCIISTRRKLYYHGELHNRKPIEKQFFCLLKFLFV